MFDNLRDSADSSFYEEEPNDLYKEPAPSSKKVASSNKAPTANCSIKMVRMREWSKHIESKVKRQTSHRKRRCKTFNVRLLKLKHLSTIINRKS